MGTHKNGKRRAGASHLDVPLHEELLPCLKGAHADEDHLIVTTNKKQITIIASGKALPLTHRRWNLSISQSDRVPPGSYPWSYPFRESVAMVLPRLTLQSERQVSPWNIVSLNADLPLRSPYELSDRPIVQVLVPI